MTPSSKIQYIEYTKIYMYMYGYFSVISICCAEVHIHDFSGQVLPTRQKEKTITYSNLIAEIIAELYLLSNYVTILLQSQKSINIESS